MFSHVSLIKLIYRYTRDARLCLLDYEQRVFQQVSRTNSPIRVLVTISIETRKNQTSINKQAVEKIKQFDIEMTKGATLGVDLIPPPSFSQGEVPFQYMYVRRHLGSFNPYINP